MTVSGVFTVSCNHGILFIIMLCYLYNISCLSTFCLVLVFSVPVVVVVGFSELVFTAGEGDGRLALTLSKTGLATFPITVEVYTEDETAVGQSTHDQ